MKCQARGEQKYEKYKAYHMPEGLEGGRCGADGGEKECVCVFESVSSCQVFGNAHIRPEMICIFVVFKWSLLC